MQAGIPPAVRVFWGGVEIMARDSSKTVIVQKTGGISLGNTPCGRSRGSLPIMKDTSKPSPIGEFRVSKNRALARALNIPDVLDRDSDGRLIEEYLKFYLSSLPFEY